MTCEMNLKTTVILHIKSMNIFQLFNNCKNISSSTEFIRINTIILILILKLLRSNTYLNGNEILAD